MSHPHDPYEQTGQDAPGQWAPPPAPPLYGQPQYGQPPYGPAQNGPPQYGQTPYGQTPYGQPPYGQTPYGQPPYGPTAAGPVPPPAVTKHGIPRTRGWLIGYAIAGVLLLSICGIGGSALFNTEARKAQNVTKTFLAAIRDHDVEKIRSTVCNRVRGNVDEESANGYASFDYKVTHTTVFGSEATVFVDLKVSMETSSGLTTTEESWTVGLVKEDDWKVCTIKELGDED